MIRYKGFRERAEYQGHVGRLQIWRYDDAEGGSRPLNPRLDLFRHSPSGFEVGYGGSGPAQTALAILADHLGDDARAVKLHQAFKWEVIAHIDRDRDFEIPAEILNYWIEAYEAAHES